MDAFHLASIISKYVDTNNLNPDVVDFIQGIVEKITAQEYLTCVAMMTDKTEAELVKELETSLFEKIIILNPEIPCLLAIQYRMNDTLLFFPNKKFYDGHLRSAEENKDNHLNLFFDKDIVFINNMT